MSTNLEVTKNRLKSVVKSTLNIQELADVPDGNLFDSLAIDSLMALELLIRIEQEFGIQISDEDLNVDLLSSLENLAEYICNAQNS